MKDKFAVGSIGGLITLLSSAPPEVRMFAFIAFAMVTVDTVTGVAAALACREMRSNTMRSKLVAKTIQFSILITFGIVTTILTGTWFFASASFWAVMVIEASSLLENLVKLQKYGGVSLGPARHFIEIMSLYFETTREHVTATTATVIPADSDNPIIQVNSIDKTIKKDRSNL